MQRISPLSWLGASLILSIGLLGLGYQGAQALLAVKALERTVTVKGLAEQEVTATLAIWPIKFTLVDNDLNQLYRSLQEKNQQVEEFLLQQGFNQAEISLSTPAIRDRQAQDYGDPNATNYRFSASSTLTVYSERIEHVRASQAKMLELAKLGIAINGADYDARPEFLFNQLNDIKPAMVEAATRNAREVAEKFAADSASRLGKIKTASQGQFSIEDRDSNNPHIKKVRVVSTVEYYLSD
ncbi:SIMPL domain-containing protein [Balneatrix alpica]|uniref:SIMPL domain-containing protein n=1 Tax=Balneatrix alpica TaxID=75684 RepID=A0ABV5ZDA1_9GAMM|nr:SIMPL domain-containing protein [Balneatrix alpica]